MGAVTFLNQDELLRELITVPYDFATAAVRLLHAARAGFDMLVVGAELNVASGATFRFGGDDSAGPAVTNPLTGTLNADFSRELGKLGVRVPDGEDLVLDHVGTFQVSGYVQLVFVAKPGA